VVVAVVLAGVGFTVARVLTAPSPTPNPTYVPQPTVNPTYSPRPPTIGPVTVPPPTNGPTDTSGSGGGGPVREASLGEVVEVPLPLGDRAQYEVTGPGEVLDLIEGYYEPMAGQVFLAVPVVVTNPMDSDLFVTDDVLVITGSGELVGPDLTAEMIYQMPGGTINPMILISLSAGDSATGVLIFQVGIDDVAGSYLLVGVSGDDPVAIDLRV
jgi:hypothetical protein